MSGRYRRRNDEAHDKRKKAYSSLEIARNLGKKKVGTVVCVRMRGEVAPQLFTMLREVRDEEGSHRDVQRHGRMLLGRPSQRIEEVSPRRRQELSKECSLIGSKATM
jgi:hypothetical protein